jgi:tetratricopeptide (TPR) repeat protein
LPPEAVPLLEDLLQTYEKLARAGGEFPKLQSQAAEANFRIGDIRQRLGQFDEAKAAYRKAIELYQGLPVVASVQAVPIKLARIYNELGKILRALRQLDEAAQMHESAIQTLKDAPERLIRRPEGRYELARSYYALASRDMLTTPGPGPKGPREGMGPGRRRPPPKDDHEGQPPDRVEDAAGSEAIALLEQLIREYPNVPEYRHLLACCLRDMYPGDRLRHKEGPPSVPNEDRAVEILRQLVKEFPKVPDYQFDLCETLGRFGPSGMGGPGKKRQRLMEAVSLSEKLMSQYPNVPDYTAAHARYLDLLGIMACQEGNFTEAEKLHRQAMTLQHRLVKQYPDVVAYRFWLTLMECSVGRVLCERGELKDSRTHLLAAIDRAENLIKNDPRLVGLRPFLGRAYQDVARVYSRTGEKDLEAEARKKATEMRPAFEGREKKK